MVEDSEERVTATRRVTLRALPLGQVVTIGLLAERMQVEPVQVIKQLMRNGIFANINEVIDFETAAGVARVFGFAGRPIEDAPAVVVKTVLDEETDNLTERAPVVTILGHVDHGKTTLLDAIRQTNIVDREAGGITQHIGAYQVLHEGRPITFIDTPGHEAFTAMRARGAQVTDIAILVVAADDGVMPQTAEAINHIKAAGVPIIVAINKMDTTDADPEKVRRQLSEHELVVEKWGGDVIDVEVSAKATSGIADLLENVLLVAEMSELRVNPDRPAVGVVVEAKMDRNRGVLATVLVQTGTLRIGNHIVVGSVRGRIRALINDKGERIQRAGPSEPVEVLGLTDLPGAGDRLVVVADEKIARDTVAEVIRRQEIHRARGTNLDQVGAKVSVGQAKELPLVVKTDVHGSMEAVRHSLEKLSTNETKVRIIHAGTGAITETDVLLAVASDAIVIGFNVGSDQGAQRLAVQDNVEIRSYTIIYRLIEDIESALHGLLDPITRDVVEGIAEVRAVFDLSRNRQSAGCYVTSGKLLRSAMARVIRSGESIFDGPVANLRRFKDDVREVATGYECGLSIDGFSAFAEGDLIEVHRQIKSG